MDISPPSHTASRVSRYFHNINKKNIQNDKQRHASNGPCENVHEESSPSKHPMTMAYHSAYKRVRREQQQTIKHLISTQLTSYQSHNAANELPHLHQNDPILDADTIIIKSNHPPPSPHVQKHNQHPPHTLPHLPSFDPHPHLLPQHDLDAHLRILRHTHLPQGHHLHRHFQRTARNRGRPFWCLVLV